jgi:peptide/nickel transport system ATP-binding protein
MVAEPLRISGVVADEARACAAIALADVGLAHPDFQARIADELSGGERQRVGLARAIVSRPALLIADEPTSMLDATRQRELLELLAGVRAAHPMALLFITHDLGLAAAACERIVVLDAGRVVEAGRADVVLTAPRAPATRALVEAARARWEALAVAVGAERRPVIGAAWGPLRPSRT